MKQNKLHRWMVLVITIIYLVILAGTIHDFRPTEFPKPTWQSIISGTWAQRLETYLTRHLGFHDVLFRVKSEADMMLGEKMIQGVYVTDDMLLEKLISEDAPATNVLAEPVNRFYQFTEMPTFMILVPSASEIYKTKLPTNAVNAEQLSRIQSVYTETVNGVRCVDAGNVLSALKDNYIYYRTDTHWTCYGAYYVYQSAIQKMGFTPVPYDRYVISHLSTEFRGDLYERTLYSGVKADVLDWYSDENGGRVTEVTAYYQDGTKEDRGRHIYNGGALQSEDMYRLYLGTPCDVLVVKTNLDNGKKLILYKDDFADCMVPFLLQHYSEICIVNLELVGEKYLTAVDPKPYTQALFLCSMRNWEQMWKR